MQPGDRLVCAFVQPQSVGATFTQWVLHCTLVPWFRSVESTEALVAALQARWQTVAPFVMVMGEAGVPFGYKGSKRVTLVELPSPLILLEQSVREYLHEQQAWLVDESTKRRHAFRPHVTEQKNERVDSGERVWCDRLYVVEQQGSQKAVVGEIVL